MNATSIHKQLRRSAAHAHSQFEEGWGGEEWGGVGSQSPEIGRDGERDRGGETAIVTMVVGLKLLFVKVVVVLK